MEFVICARSRTGSNLLVSLLDSHPGIVCRAEELRHVGESSPAEKLDQALRQWPGILACGFKLFYYHPIDGDPRALRKLLYGRPGLRAIHLTRWNLLDVCLSEAMARHTGVWLGESESSSQIHLPVRTVLTCHDRTVAFEENERKLLTEANVPTLEISYEDLSSDAPRVAQAAFEFLGVPAVPASSALTKQIRRSKAELIVNYDELRCSPLLAGRERIVFD